MIPTGDGLLARCIRLVWETLVVYGSVMYPAGDPRGNPHDIPPLHPERLRPDIPLSLFERSVQAQLRRPHDTD